MNTLKRLVQFGILSSFLFTSALHAEDLSSTQKAKSEGMFSNFFSDVMLRNTQASDPGKSFKGTWEARYTLGSKFFNDFMTAQVVFGAKMKGNTAVVKDRGTRIETSYDVFSNDYVYFHPLVEVWFPGSGKSNIRTVLGSNQGVMYKAGDFSMGLHHYFLAYLGSEASQTPLYMDGEVLKAAPNLDKKMAKSYNLNYDDDAKMVKVDQRGAKLHQIAVLATKWKPSFLGGFSMGLNGYMEQVFNPQMEVSSNNKIRLARTGVMGVARYNVDNVFYGRLRAAYDFTKDTDLKFDTYLYDSGNVELLSTLSVKLF